MNTILINRDQRHDIHPLLADLISNATSLSPPPATISIALKCGSHNHNIGFNIKETQTRELEATPLPDDCDKKPSISITALFVPTELWFEPPKAKGDEKDSKEGMVLAKQGRADLANLVGMLQPQYLELLNKCMKASFDGFKSLCLTNPEEREDPVYLQVCIGEATTKIQDQGTGFKKVLYLFTMILLRHHDAKENPDGNIFFLLLDEISTFLYPGLSQSMLVHMKELFMDLKKLDPKKPTRCVLIQTTHSPTYLVLAEQSSNVIGLRDHLIVHQPLPDEHLKNLNIRPDDLMAHYALAKVVLLMEGPKDQQFIIKLFPELQPILSSGKFSISHFGGHLDEDEGWKYFNHLLADKTKKCFHIIDGDNHSPTWLDEKGRSMHAVNPNFLLFSWSVREIENFALASTWSPNYFSQTFKPLLTASTTEWNGAISKEVAWLTPGTKFHSLLTGNEAKTNRDDFIKLLGQWKNMFMSLPMQSPRNPIAGTQVETKRCTQA